MLDIIQNNPFRILGVYADASAAEIKRNETKIRRFLEVGKSVSFPSDELGGGDIPARTTGSVDHALAEISLPQSKIKYACFWYNNGTTREIVNKSIDYYSHNQITDAINTFAQLLSSRVVFDEFVRSIDDTCSLSAEEVKEAYINILMEQLSSDEYRCLLDSKLANETICERINVRLIEVPANHIQSLIEACKKVEKGDNVALVSAAQKLWSDSQQDLKEIAEKIGQESSQYCNLRDSVVKQVLQSCINAVNSAQDNVLDKGGTTYRHVTKTAQQLILEISSIPVSSFLSQRIETNKSVINDLAEHAKERIDSEMVNDEHYCWYCGKLNASSNCKHNITMYKETRREYFPQRRVWFKTLTVGINRCEECKNHHEQLSDGCLKIGLLCLAPNIILLVILLAADATLWFMTLGFLVSILVAWGISASRTKSKCKELGIKAQDDVYDHPVIKYLIRDGWDDSKPTA